MPSPSPLDPRVHAAIIAAVREALAQERELSLGPIKQEIVQLRETDRRHSGTHADLTKGLRDSKPEIEEAVMKRVEKKLDDFRADMKATPAAATAALAAANNATQAANSAAIDTTQIRSKQEDQIAAAKLRFWLTIIPVLAGAIVTILQALRHV